MTFNEDKLKDKEIKRKFYPYRIGIENLKKSL